MRSSGVVTIAKLTFREAARRKILLAALVLGLLFLVVFGLGLYFIRRDLVHHGQFNNPMTYNGVFNFFALSGLYVVNFLYGIMTVLTSVDTIAGEISSGTVQALAAKPLHRWEILLGKWIGYVVMLTLYLLLMGGGVVGVVRVVTGYEIPHALRGLALIWLSGLLLLNVTFLGGTRLSTLANGVLVFASYGIAFVGGWIEQIGAYVNSRTAVNIGILSSLLLPSEALWKRAAYEMRSLVVEMMGFSPFTTAASLPSPLMLAYAVAYALVSLALTVWSFSRRDL
jgi:ABC-type transport system involved in multi-copper enzyme maturation permease subunit